jgi:hypothetical protein
MIDRVYFSPISLVVRQHVITQRDIIHRWVYIAIVLDSHEIWQVNCSYSDAVLASSYTDQTTKMATYSDYDRRSVIRLHQIIPL